MFTEARRLLLLLVPLLVACDPTTCARHSDCPVDEICSIGLCSFAPADAGGDAGDASTGDSGSVDAGGAAALDPELPVVTVPDTDAPPAPDSDMSAAQEEQGTWR